MTTSNETKGIGRPAPRRRRVAELFAGVGGFRLALEGHPASEIAGSGWNVVWSNQWEPSTKVVQQASACYVRQFGDEGHVCEDIRVVLDEVDMGQRQIPEHELVVGGFPCQDFSVAQPRNGSAGIDGRKGALWWQVHRFLEMSRPAYVFLENVDRLLKSPARQRGRDFAVILAGFHELGYSVEWRVVNSADYGFPQRRRRVFIIAYRNGLEPMGEPPTWLTDSGVLARALPISKSAIESEEGHLFPAPMSTLSFDDSIQSAELLRSFANTSESFQFENSGVMAGAKIWTVKLEPQREGASVLGSILLDDAVALERYPDLQVADDLIPVWEQKKGAKDQIKVNGGGHVYRYREGSVPFPDPLDRPARTITTQEGGWGPDRSKHVVQSDPEAPMRRLAPEELERLDGFPDGWTEGMTPGRRAFMMGNALVVGVVHRIGAALHRHADEMMS